MRIICAVRKVPTQQEIVFFIRSVLPSSPAHWLLLVGSTFLFVSRDVRWWPTDLLSVEGFWTWALSAHAVAWTFVACGAAGYYVAFIGQERTAKRILWWILLASLTAILGLVLLAYFYLPPSGKQSASVLDPANSRVLPHLRAVLLGLIGIAGFQLAAVGFALVALFYFVLRSERTSVPVTVGVIESVAATTDALPSDNDHRRTTRFVWIMVALPPVSWILTMWTDSFIAFVATKFRTVHQAHPWLQYCYAIVDLAFFAALVAVATGRQPFRGLRESLRLPDVKYALLAAVYPMAIIVVWPLSSYAHDRILWATYQWSKILPPSLPSYFHVLTLASFVYFPSIIVEEIAWRGYLQPRFIRRYGTIRGIFLVGIVWGAFHFVGFFYSGGMFHVTWRLIMRLIGTCILSYTLAWLTIESKSIFPAAITHELYDVTLSFPGRGHHAPNWFFLVLWAALGFVLFQFYAPEAEQQTNEPVQPVIA